MKLQGVKASIIARNATIYRILQTKAGQYRREIKTKEKQKVNYVKKKINTNVTS